MVDGGHLGSPEVLQFLWYSAFADWGLVRNKGIESLCYLNIIYSTVPY